jgi:hypothetical protein
MERRPADHYHREGDDGDGTGEEPVGPSTSRRLARLPLEASEEPVTGEN